MAASEVGEPTGCEEIQLPQATDIYLAPQDSSWLRRTRGQVDVLFSCLGCVKYRFFSSLKPVTVDKRRESSGPTSDGCAGDLLGLRLESEGCAPDLEINPKYPLYHILASLAHIDLLNPFP
ncbi:hypothetical protein PAAG_00895 [Paracoccidioides lutzii Pb01]|uniref:Uncharacterized protein n=1 Tax=Paracoccidioides lutzii (strain ATCC MYA-826 / Pb01) TaxID=502779 RepID=C1GQV0_PARBA|nr:hypothetical protein PAAG_00895 [Paracoccidioides lutzii Pb01]EEH37974.1 hypothetical protein PAAG_00895 [Paracoccidioides lutzii Pb01]